MLHTQKFLREAGQDGLKKLEETYGIKAAKHKTLPLVILNYDQIESPKTHEIVRECRGLILELGTYNLIARSFDRFFNWGEVQEEMKEFDWKTCCGTSKEDGSLGILFFYDDQWIFCTRGAFGCDNTMPHGQTWTELFCDAIGVKDMNELLGARALLENEVYVFELASMFNKVVRKYPTPEVYLLTILDMDKPHTHSEMTREYTERMADCYRACGLKISLPEVKKFDSFIQVHELLLERSIDDPTFEGYVLRDAANRRWKVKSSTYVALHQMRGGDNIFLPKYQIPFILNGEIDEVINYFPEVEESVQKNAKIVEDAFEKLRELWYNNYEIEDQKEFALKVAREPFSGILFQLRKDFGEYQTIAHLKSAWRDSGDKILKTLFRT